MALVSQDSGPVDRDLLPSGAPLALRAIESAAVSSGAGGSRATPSAGAIYPYEFYVVAGSGDAAAPGGDGVVLAVDPSRRQCRRISSRGGPGIAERCRQAGVEPPKPGGALVILVTRPWLSMRKYGDRGYLYAQLDTAHVAVNALGMAGDRGELHTRLTPGPLERLLDIETRCREIHSVLRLAPAAEEPRPDGWTIRSSPSGEGPAPRSEDQPWLELICWQSLRPLLSTGAGRPPSPGGTPLARFAESFTPAPALTADQWAALSWRRASSKQYAPRQVPRAVVEQVLATAGTPLRTDLPRGSGLGVTLVARSVTGLPPGVIRVTGAGTLEPVDLPGGDEFVRACVHQRHLRDAAAFVVFHAPRAELVADRSSYLRELLFRAGGLAQLMYLGAAAAGLGITAVGGFDAPRWRAMAGLPEDHDPVYLVSLGADGGGTIKWDRLSTPYAHAHAHGQSQSQSQEVR